MGDNGGTDQDKVVGITPSDILKAGAVVIDSVLNTDGDENMILQRNSVPKLTLEGTITTFNPKPITAGAQTGEVKIFGVLHINGKVNQNGSLNLGCKMEQTAFWFRFRHFGTDSNSSVGNADPGHRSIAVGQIFAYGQIQVNDTIVSTSDGRVKTQEKLIENATDTLMKVVPKSYMKHAYHRVDYDDERPVDLDASGNKIEQKKEYGVSFR